MTEILLPSPRILSFSWGKMEVESLGQGKDFKLWPGGGRDWDWSEHGTSHSRGIQLGDIEELLKHGTAILILTTGRLRRLKIARGLIAQLKTMELGKVIVTDTKKGVRLYNEYVKQQRAVGGLFHSTC